MHRVAYVQTREQPRGNKGSRLSVHETARNARVSRDDPGVHSWSILALKQAGAPRHPEKMGRALLAASRRDKIYVPDPVDTEMIVQPTCMFGKCGGLEFGGGDCDDLAAGLAAALLSVGVQCAIVGQYNFEDVLVHVLVAMWDGSRWWYADPSSETHELGVADASQREQWIDVMTLREICHGQCDQETVQAPPSPAIGHKAAVFVGVSADPDDPTCVSVEPQGFGFWSFAAGLVVGASIAATAAVLLRARR